jgi:hypothetical protein
VKVLMLGLSLDGAGARGCGETPGVLSMGYDTSVFVTSLYCVIRKRMETRLAEAREILIGQFDFVAAFGCLYIGLQIRE